MLRNCQLNVKSGVRCLHRDPAHRKDSAILVTQATIHSRDYAPVGGAPGSSPISFAAFARASRAVNFSAIHGKRSGVGRLLGGTLAFSINARRGICERFGPERLLFGSRLPLLCPGAARHAIERAGISEQAKELIAGGNLRRLLAEAGR